MKKNIFDVKQRIKCIGIRVTNSEHEKLQEISKDWNISVTTAARIIVQNYLKKQKIKGELK